MSCERFIGVFRPLQTLGSLIAYLDRVTSESSDYRVRELLNSWKEHLATDTDLFYRLQEECLKLRDQTFRLLQEKYGFTAEELQEVDLELILLDILLYPEFATKSEPVVRIHAIHGVLEWFLELETGKVELLEPTNAPTEWDIRFRDKLEKHEQWLDLWTIQNPSCFKGWMKSGIPAKTSFVRERWMVNYYLDVEEDSSILVHIKVPASYLTMVNPVELLTVKEVPLSEFGAVEVFY